MQSLLNKLAALSIILASASVIWVVGTVRLVRPAEMALRADGQAAGLPSEPVTLADAAIVGGDANVGVVVYSDFECPYCARFAKDTFPQLVDAYVATGRAFVAFRHLPLETIHPHALRAATTAECARRQGRFWDAHDAIFLASPQELGTLSVDKLIKSIGLDVRAFESCLDVDGREAVWRDVELAQRLGIRGTPTFLFGVKENGNAIRVTRREGGAIPFRAFAAILDATIGEAEQTQAAR